MKLFHLLSLTKNLEQMLWSQAFVGAQAGDDLVIPADKEVLFDLTQSPVYGHIDVMGRIVVDQSKDTELQFNSMMVMHGGEYICGTETVPFPRTRTHKIVPSGPRSNEVPVNLSDPANGVPTHNRAIMWMPGSKRSWIAEVPAVVITKLAETANIGATSIKVRTPVTWKAGTELELSTTQYWQEGIADLPAITTWPAEHARKPGWGQERIVVAADVVNSTTIPLTAPLQFRHHGQLQYLVPPAYEDIPGTNLSYTYRAIQPTDSFGTVNGNPILGSKVLDVIAAGANPVLDNCATVGVLSHPIKFHGPQDSDWTTHGYGATDMVMGVQTVSMTQGVEFQYVGKAGILGAYPMHDHVRSYIPYGSEGSGTYLGDVDGSKNYIKKCSFKDSSNRGVTIHGTCGATVYQNVFSKIDTHCIFLEDGSERRNIIDGNFVSGVRMIGYGKKEIKAHDKYRLMDSGPSGIWYTSPDNYLRNNIFMGCYIGIWNAFTGDYFTGYNTRGTRTGNGEIGYTSRAAWGAGVDTYPSSPNLEVITLTAINSTTFSRVGSVSGTMSNVTVDVEATHGPFTYKINSGSIPFVAGDKFIFDAKRFRGCFGQTRDVDFSPGYTPNLEHFNNEAGCCVNFCMRTQPAVIQESGDMVGGHTSAGMRIPGVNWNDVNPFEKLNLWKSENWYGNEADHPHYVGWSCGGLKKANPSIGKIAVGITGNVNATSLGGTPASFDKGAFFANTLDDYYLNDRQTMMVSYGGGVNRVNSILVPAAATKIYIEGGALVTVQQDGGVIRFWDFYLYPVNGHFAHDTNSVILGADPGYMGIRFPPLHLLSQFGQRYLDVAAGKVPDPWSQGNSGALKLPDDGTHFGVAGGWWVHDSPFLLYGTNGGIYAQSPPGYEELNGKLLGPEYDYYGVQVYDVNGRNALNTPINYTRLQTDAVTPVPNGTWNTGAPQMNYPNMRHAAILHGAIIDTSWSRSDFALPKSMRVRFYMMTPANAYCVLSVDWDASFPITQARFGTNGSVLDVNYHNFAQKATKQQVLDSTTCAYWVDTANNKAWFKIVGGDLINNNLSDPEGGFRRMAKEMDLTLNNNAYY